MSFDYFELTGLFRSDISVNGITKFRKFLFQTFEKFKIDLLIKTRKKSYIEPSESLLNLLNEKVLAYFLAINSSLEDNPEDIEYTDLYLLSIKKKFNNAEYYSVSYPDHNRRMLKLTIDRTKLKKRKS